jgi:hypothetical protein
VKLEFLGIRNDKVSDASDPRAHPVPDRKVCFVGKDLGRSPSPPQDQENGASHRSELEKTLTVSTS